MHAKAFGNFDHAAADVPGTDHAQGLAQEIESLESFKGKIPPAGAVNRLNQVVADYQQESKDVLCNRIVTIYWDIADCDAVFFAILQINMIKTG